MTPHRRHSRGHKPPAAALFWLDAGVSFAGGVGAIAALPLAEAA
jgi:hypothetical protein